MSNTKQPLLTSFVDTVSSISDPNLLNVVAKPEVIGGINTICFKTDAPEHISSWKQFCKTEMSLFHTLSMFR